MEGDEADLTRKQRREQARANRKELEEAEAAGAARRKRLTQLGIVAAVVVVGHRRDPHRHGRRLEDRDPEIAQAKSPTVVSEVDSLVAGIPQHGNVLGNPNAPLTLEYFGDLECPDLQGVHAHDRCPRSSSSWVRSGKLKIEYRSLETATREPEVFRTSRSPHWRPASRTRCGTTLSSSTTSREKRTAAMSLKATCSSSRSRCPG